MMKSVVLVLLALLCLAQATHFRFGTIDWQIEDPSQPNVVTFTLSTVFRTAYFTVDRKTPIFVGKNDLKMNFEQNEWKFGDGTSLADFYGVVDQIGEDSFNAHFTVRHTYPISATPKNYTCKWSAYARLSTLVNNADGDWVLNTLVTLGVSNYNSPRSSSLPIISAIENTLNDINLLASDAEGAVVFSLSSDAEMGSLGSRGKKLNQPAGFYIQGTTDVKWNTVGLALGLYNAQVKITDIHGAFVVLDFLLIIRVASVHPPPYFIAPTPVDGSTVEIDAGFALVLNFHLVAKSDIPTDTVVITAGSLPGGVVVGTSVGKNPADVTITWIPTVFQAGTFTFTFQASNGFGTATVAFFVVVNPAAPTASPTPMPPTASPTPMPPTATPTPIPATIAPTAAPFCGDGMCSMVENCATCPQDCNECPIVIYNRNTGDVVTSNTFVVGATIRLTPYDGVSKPNANQAWRYDPQNMRIQHFTKRDLILGAGPVAQKLATSVRTIAWDFKGALANSTESPQTVHRFKLVPVPNTIWSYLQNTQLDGSGAFAKGSCLSAPYNKPTNAAWKEVWGPICKAGDYFVQHFRFWTYQCPNGEVCNV